jgi:hypothetical protein
MVCDKLVCGEYFLRLSLLHYYETAYNISFATISRELFAHANKRLFTVIISVNASEEGKDDSQHLLKEKETCEDPS